MSDLARIADIVRDHYLVVAAKTYGESGTEAIRSLFPYLRKIYAAIDYESVNVGITVFRMLASAPLPFDSSEAYQLSDLADITVHNQGALTLQVLDDGSAYLWIRDLHPDEIPTDAIAYRYEPYAGERFWVKGAQYSDASAGGYPAMFGTPVFVDLSDALAHYGTHVARASECAILQQAWREDARVMWKAGPEATMRRSLHQYLRGALRNGRPDVHQEAPTDDRNPVEITVRWPNSNRIAVIEIKWLGKSGLLDPPRQTREWSEKRAKDGLLQLADYLELTRIRAPYHDRRGYLVVFDGRRANVRPETERCGRDDGLKFKDANIAYDEACLARHDVAAPLRFFCEPRLVFGPPSQSRRRSRDSSSIEAQG